MMFCPACGKTYASDRQRCAQDGADLVPADVDRPLEIGDLVGEYRIEMKLADGGCGTVYRAVHPLIAKQAAIKVLHHELCLKPDAVSRFIGEARAANEIQHRHIVDVFGFGRLPDGRHYYVMELLTGQTLDHYLLTHGGQLSVEKTVEILKPVARALDAAHAHGIVHRDLKPDNIIVGDDEEGRAFPKVLDFGIAKLLTETTRSSHVTRTGVAFGTPLYMSPEQCRGRGVDRRTDIYSLGVITYLLLTGRTPFDGPVAMDLLMHHVKDPPPRPSQHRPDLPPHAERAVLAMLEKDPARRPPSLQAAIAALEGLAGAEVSRPPARDPVAAPPEGVTRWRRRPLAALGAGLAVLLAGLVGWVAIGRWRRDPAPPPVAYEVTPAPAPAPASPAAPPASPSPARPEVMARAEARPEAKPEPRPARKKVAAAAKPEPGRPATGSASGLTRDFATKEKQVSACFARHATSAGSLPPLYVRFQVGGDGKVLAASVEPVSLAGTPLATCLVAAARTVHFEGVDKAMTFRIPVRANVREGGR